MNYISTLGWGFMEIIWCIVAIIPKMIYFFFACFASAIDAMQALIRKLAGLDVFYIKTAGENSAWSFSGQGTQYSNVDPLTEFIYGILGIGKNAASYKALNTVFWSLSIFALIVLVVCTMIAIIKSHYNEDYASTNPWKYIYTAIKAILTYAAMPVVIVIGMQLATFVLRTLDHITAGYSSEDTLKGVYGQNVVPLFKDGTGEFDGIYGHYDFFGFGSPTSATTFGGMLFKAAAYSSNRARTGSNTKAQYLSLKHQNIQIFGNQSCAAYSALQAGTSNSEGSNVSAQVEYIAYQVDYAFQNNLRLNNTLSIYVLDDIFEGVPFIHGFDAPTYQEGLNGFSKFNVSAIWFFYDLWQFNFIVAFGGGVTIFSLVLSIIFGMMSRLIQGAALFLIYPTMLSIAPLDQFKAFKGWGQKFMAQVLMAVGSITAVNVLMLIIPYLNNFSFFNIGLIDAIINMVLLITGIVMVKDFIGIVSGFIGAADAASEGEKAKGQAFNAIKSGFETTAKIGMGTARFAVGGVRLAGAGVRAGMKAVRKRRAREEFRKEASAAQGEANEAQATLDALKKKAPHDLAMLDTSEQEKTKNAIIEAASAKGKKKSFEQLGIADTEENRAAYESTLNAVKNRGKGVKSADAAAAAFAETGAGKQLAADNEMNERAKKTNEEAHAIHDAAIAAAEADVKTKKAKVDGVVAEAKQHNHDLKLASDGSHFMTKREEAQVAKDYKQATKDAAKEEKQKLKAEGKWKETKKERREEAKRERIKNEESVFGKGTGLADKFFNAKGAGLQMADSLLKTLKAVPDACGFDKFLKGLADIFKGGLTLKGGAFENFGKGKPAEGDAAQREASNKRSNEASQQAALLKEIRDQLKNNNKAIQEGNQQARSYYSSARNRD